MPSSDNSPSKAGSTSTRTSRRDDTRYTRDHDRYDDRHRRRRSPSPTDNSRDYSRHSRRRDHGRDDYRERSPGRNERYRDDRDRRDQRDRRDDRRDRHGHYDDRDAYDNRRREDRDRHGGFNDRRNDDVAPREEVRDRRRAAETSSKDPLPQRDDPQEKQDDGFATRPDSHDAKSSNDDAETEAESKQQKIEAWKEKRKKQGTLGDEKTPGLAKKPKVVDEPPRRMLYDGKKMQKKPHKKANNWILDAGAIIPKMPAQDPKPSPARAPGPDLDQSASERALDINVLGDSDDEDKPKMVFKTLEESGAAEFQPPIDEDDDEAIEGLEDEEAEEIPEEEIASIVAELEEEHPDMDPLSYPSMAKSRWFARKRSERTQAYAKNLHRDGGSNDTPMGGTSDDNDEDMDPLDAYMKQVAADMRREESAPRVKKAIVPAFDMDDDMRTAVGDIAADAPQKKRVAEVPIVDHSTVDYLPFKKAFYKPLSEVASLNEEEIAELRFRLDGIKVHGQNVPAPVTKWSLFGLSEAVTGQLRVTGFENPTAIQAQALPAIMAGRDVIGIAKTGSGKTLAFLLPMFRHVLDQPDIKEREGPIALIMSPTRELAIQTHRECEKFCKSQKLRSMCAYGGSPMLDQIAEVKRRPHIIVCTPGRLVDLLATNKGGLLNLKRVTYLVIDEADRMFDMGFEPQMMKIINNIRPDRQTVLFSATFPKSMEALARKTLTAPAQIIVGGKSIVAAEITQVVEVIDEDKKFHRLLKLLGDVHSDEEAQSLIFVEKQGGAEDLLNKLLQKGYPCNTTHGGQDQDDRTDAISNFKQGHIPVLVATSVAARGLDVKGLKMVVNYDCPNHMEDYVHRAGRTGRAGATGTAVTFITPEQGRLAKDVLKALTASKQTPPDELLKLSSDFQEAVKAGNEKKARHGFGGRGIEALDRQREAQRNKERKAFNLGGEDEESDPEEDLAAREKAKKVEEMLDAKPAPAEVAGPATSNAPTSAAAAALDELPDDFKLDSDITVVKNERQEEAKGANLTPGELAAQRAATINSRLRQSGDVRGGAPIDNKGPDAGLFHSTMEVNDLPQKARWAVTNRTNVAKILESTGTSITNKGNFYPAGKVPGPTEAPKLYILVEGDTELMVKNAITELRGLARQALLSMADNDVRVPAPGRYSVV